MWRVRLYVFIVYYMYFFSYCLFDTTITTKIEKLTHCDMRLTHWGLVTPYDDIDMGQHWLQQWLAAWRHQAINRTNIELLHFMVTVFLSVFPAKI